VISVSVCLYVCVFASTNISGTACPNFTTFLGMLHAAVVRSSGGVAIILAHVGVTYIRDDNGSVGHGSRVKWVNKSEWVTWVTGQYS